MPGPVQSIERAAAILRLLARGTGRLGIGEIATSLDLAKGTAHGILRTLHDVGFVEQDRATGKYQLGAALLHLGTSYLDVNELRSRAINWADALAARSGEAVRIGTPLEGNVLVVHHVFRPDDTLQTLDVGTLLPPHATALGKVLLAYDGNLAAHTQDGDLESFTRRTITRPAPLRWARRWPRCARTAGRSSRASWCRARPASPHPSAPTAAWWSARWASPAPRSGCAAPAGNPSRRCSDTSAMPPARSRATSAPRVSGDA